MNRILVVGPSWVGDMVMAQSLFRTLRDRFKDCHITVLAPSWSALVLARMPEVDANQVMPMGHGHFGISSRWRLGRHLKEQFNQAIVLPGSFKSALVPWFARIPVRTGFIGEQRYGLLNDIRRLDKTALPFTVQRFVSLGLTADARVPELRQLPKPKLAVDPDSVEDVTRRFAIDRKQSLLVLCPGAEYGPAKQWPAQHFAAVALDRMAAGWQVVILGSEKDSAVSREICNQASGCHDLCGNTSLEDAIDLMSVASHVVTNDSGLMHIAAATGARVIALYGSSTDAFTPPLTDNAVRLSLPLDCRPCFQRHCPLGHLDCLNKLEPDRVLAEFNADQSTGNLSRLN